MRIPSFSRFTHNDDFRAGTDSKRSSKSSATLVGAGALGGAAAGAVIGAGVGYLQGLEGLKSPQVTFTDETYYSTTPQLVGAYYDDADLVTQYNSSTEQWEYYWTSDDFSPIIERNAYRPYQRPVFSSEQPSLLKSVVGGATKGAAVGAVVGAAGTVLARAAGIENVGAAEVLESTPLSMAAGGVGGAIIGGLAGYHAGTVAQANAHVEIRTAPTYETQQIGWMPWERNAGQIAREFGKGGGDYRIFYSEVGDRYGSPPFEGQAPVYSKVPVGEHQQEFRSSGITPFKGAAFGAVSGGILGLAAGAAASVVARMLNSDS